MTHIVELDYIDTLEANDKSFIEYASNIRLGNNTLVEVDDTTIEFTSLDLPNGKEIVSVDFYFTDYDGTQYTSMKTNPSFRKVLSTIKARLSQESVVAVVLAASCPKRHNLYMSLLTRAKPRIIGYHEDSLRLTAVMASEEEVTSFVNAYTAERVEAEEACPICHTLPGEEDMMCNICGYDLVENAVYDFRGVRILPPPPAQASCHMQQPAAPLASPPAQITLSDLPLQVQAYQAYVPSPDTLEDLGMTLEEYDDFAF